MQTKRIFSMILALALVVGLIAPVGNLVLTADATIYGENLEQATEPVIGESYYLGADVDGTMMYFRHGTVTDTVPYSLVVTDNFNHNWTFPVTLEAPSALTDGNGHDQGFQMTYINPTSNALSRIYCTDTLKDATLAGQTGIMDTGANTAGPYINRHNFYIEDLDGVKLIKSTGNANVLVIKQVPQTVDGETNNVWRMLGVPVKELANEGVYPVMLLKEHTHTFGKPTVDGIVATSTCTGCGYVETVYDQTVAKAEEAVIGESYYLAANVEGVLKYFTTGTVTTTAPYSLVTTERIAVAVPVTLESSTLTNEKFEGGFQFTYDNKGTITRIYCMDVLKDETTAGQTGIMDTGANSSTPYKNRHSFWVDEVDGVKVLRKYGNDNILVVKYFESTETYRMLGVPEAELANEGVYPVSLMTAHQHEAGEQIGKITNEGHYYGCHCGAVDEEMEAHTYGTATVNGSVASRTCTVCGYEEIVYEQSIVKADDAVVGNSYYLAANVDGTMMYFRHGQITDTVPYSLVVTDNFNHDWTALVTLEDPSALTDGNGHDQGFQLTYINPSNDALSRIYCMDSLKDATVAGQTGIMDTGANTSGPNINRHNFYIAEVGGEKVIKSTGNANVLVIKQVPQTVNGETNNVWRILGVPEAELANEGVYPVSLMAIHQHQSGAQIAKITDTGHSYGCWCGSYAEEIAHTYGEATHDNTNNTHTRSCTACGYSEVVYGTQQKQIKTPVVGETYYLTANVNGQLLSFLASGGYTETTPYSLRTSATLATVTLEKAVQSGKGEFQLVEATGKYIYSVAAGAGATTSSGYVTDPAKVSFLMDEVNGVPVIRAYGTKNILAAKYSDAKSAWRIFAVAESELANEGVYPVMLSVAHEHTAADSWTVDAVNGTQSRLCTVCGAAAETLYGTDLKASQVTEPVIGNSYYLAANAGGKLIFFRHGQATDTAPYSLVATDNFNHNWVLPVTIEDPTTANEGTEVGFQMTYTNPSTEALARIYCYDVLKDTTDVPNQTGVMDTGINSANYKGRHTFEIAEVNGVKVLRKLSNNNILVVKYNETKGEWRMLGVPESELANEGVYPAMLVNVHTHSFGQEYSSDSENHWTVCDCGQKDLSTHSFGQWTLDPATKQQSASCTVCGYEMTVSSPYFDTVDSEGELKAGLAETVYNEETAAYTVSGGKDYFLMTEINGELYYLRNAGRTAQNNPESVLTTSGYSLYTTNDPNNTKILKTKVTLGNTEGTYVIYSKNDNDRAIYVNDEGKDGIVDTGLTLFRGVYDNATYLARSEFMWDAETGYLYQNESGVKYILVIKQMTATYTGTDATTGETVTLETANEWRMIAVPMAEAVPEQGNYPVKLAQHSHNLTAEYASEGASCWRSCDCGYKAMIDWTISLSDTIGVSFNLTMEEPSEVKVTVAGEEVSAELIQKSNRVYSVFVPLAAAQMNDQIVLSVDGLTVNGTFTVRAYADMILASEDYSDAEKNLVKAMLNYGSAAQNYFGYNTGALAGEGIDVAVTMPADAAGVGVQDDLAGVEFYGASIVHENATAARFYFTADTVEGLTFTEGGNVYEPVSKDGMYYIEVSGIAPQNLHQEMNVVVSNGENNLAVSYSPLAYITRTYQKAEASAELKAMVQALYGYHKAAKAYITSLYLGNDFALKSQKVTSLYEGVDQYKSVYVAADHGEVEAYAIVIDANAGVELKVSAGAWSESSTAANPGETKTVVKHFRDMKNSGENVLAMINGGFFDLNSTKTMKPYGMQIVDGVVYQAPVAGGNYSDNWFGMTTDGKYVISDAAGYESTYAGNVQQGVGGGKLLMIDGVAQNITSPRDYRTAVGVNAEGDLVLVAVADATYSDVNQIFVDLNMDIVTVLNLDGGGSTAMYVPGAFYPKALILGDDGLLPREVADAVAIVVKD